MENTEYHSWTPAEDKKIEDLILSEPGIKPFAVKEQLFKNLRLGPVQKRVQKIRKQLERGVHVVLPGGSLTGPGAPFVAYSSLLHSLLMLQHILDTFSHIAE